MRNEVASTLLVSNWQEQYESLWRIWDDYISRLDDTRWNLRYGPDWTFASVPYHMAYFDEVMVADAIEKGGELPEAEQLSLTSLRKINDWNAAEFAKRPAGQTPQETLARWYRQRDRIRSLLARMSDADLDKPAFSHLLPSGWSTVSEALTKGRSHTWSEGFEWGFRVTGTPPTFPAEIEHDCLAMYLNVVGLFADRDAAKRIQNFSVLWDLQGKSGGAWTIRVQDGDVSLHEEREPRPDLTITTTAATFAYLFKRMKNPVLLMLTGQLKAKPLGKMGLFGQLFKAPSLDREVNVPATGSVMVG